MRHPRCWSNLFSPVNPTMYSSPFNKNHTAKALRRLSVLAGEANTVLELAFCHGTLIAVAYASARGRLGKVRPNDIAARLAASVRDELRLRADWLETDVAIFVAGSVLAHSLCLDEFAPGVILSVNTAAKILALKLHLLSTPLPAEATDLRDVEFLLEKIKVSSLDQIQRIYVRAFPGDPLSETAIQVINRGFRVKAVLRH